MNDKRELLKLAAKAAGVKIDKSPYNGGGSKNIGFDLAGHAVIDWHNGKIWNPLEDDGDALRLAVKLRLDISFNDAAQCVYADESMEPFTRTPDPYAATRLAIVRAAAEVGRGILQIISDDTWPEDNYYATMAEAQGFRKVEE